MNILKTKAWDNFIYSLLYPSFLGSMIYELVPIEYNIDYCIKLILSIFFVVDYLHLYNDMHRVVRIEDRDWKYFWCDVLTSVAFFLSFVFAKTHNYAITMFCIMLVPAIIFGYKQDNSADVIFFKFYGPLFISLGFLYILVLLTMPAVLIIKHTTFLFWYIFFELTIYVGYVFCYNNKYSLREDIILKLARMEARRQA